MQTNYQVANTQALPAGAHKVLRNTYMMLGLTMVPTVIGALIGMSMNFSWMAASPIMSSLIMLAVMFGLFFAISANRNNSFGVVLLFGLTFFMGLMLGPILQVALNLRNGGQLVGLAAGGTGLILLIVASLANLFFQVPAASLAISAVAVLLFSGFILYDVNRIVRGGETNYIMATLSLYISIYQLFVNLLQLLMAFMGERD
ncbi:Bax inhibitor-1 family protein [Methylobacillus flagellatus]|uniref:Modulator of FtsH protease n=1 Tax=Methylobacillus flagellatus (strain ATCC 51484 / DSM 6875 / VKM B-1610 / KT) TaxID=265072 RepID=Q1H077_METFK|nr:Bax inhibitor-1 family protein [Methylobacillus flagellatus]ABE50110.1 protein of unknown function UPF0005 [Methylobacillus flagellatus KT]